MIKDTGEEPNEEVHRAARSGGVPSVEVGTEVGCAILPAYEWFTSLEAL